MEIPSRQYDEDGNLIATDEDLDDENEERDEDDSLDNDDTYFSSITPEADVKDMEEEGLSIEDVTESEDE